ncbi:MAG: gliding motility-associated C-terminal domain-containing protein [Bacteroidia bacterium]|nr:gliding motility-associated C-terminal domain-containing protein [Bacteroidia bacterium]
MNKLFKILFLFAFLISFKSAFSSHNRAGEITYKWLFGFTYEIQVTTYTNTQNTTADRCYDTVYFGDGTYEAVPRVNGVTGGLCSGGVGDGVMISTWIKLNIYKTTHTYPGANCYTLTMADPNRNQGVLNMTNSQDQPFFIMSQLCIGTFSGANSSPVLTNPPIDDACSGHCFIHNAGAFDIDGDSLSYELSNCYAGSGTPAFGFFYPAGITIDPVTGDFLWCSPVAQGMYNFAFIIREWRKNPADGTYSEVGYVLRDMQVTVGSCTNIAPSIQDIHDTCIVAGTTLNVNITATDPDIGQIITLTSYGGPYALTVSPANFSSLPSASPATATFSWVTDCKHIRLQPYMVTVKAEDNDPQIALIDFETFFIHVVAPAPVNLTVQPSGTSMLLAWNNSGCNSTTGNYVYRYLIYRIDSCLSWTHAPCETGVPSYTGYTLIGYTNGVNDTTFIDNNNGLGLNHGTDYSYIVVGLFGDGAQSYASAPACNHLLKDVPLITNVDVKVTSSAAGQIFVAWAKPVVDASNPDKLDTIVNPGPYEFRLMEHSNFTGTFTQVYSVSEQFFSQLNSLSDTTYTSVNLNSAANPYTYRVDFYCNGNLKGSTQTASSVFLTATGNDNRIKLDWTYVVSWTNYFFYVYKETFPGSAVWNLIDSTTLKTYTDSNLVNGQTYCYKVLSKGEYSDPDIIHPLFNWSEEVCAQPIDKEAPCQPTMALEGDCNTSLVKITWLNPNNYCCDDAVSYNIYYKPGVDEPFVLINSVNLITDTVYVYDGSVSIAGCFAVTAVDSFGNESTIVNEVCIDNCPEYELPNIITINGDGMNDTFIPVKNKFVKDIDLKIYDRWGLLVFETTDPKINWDGKNKLSKQLCTNGTYYYVCTVNTIRLEGIVSFNLKGWLQIIDK